MAQLKKNTKQIRTQWIINPDYQAIQHFIGLDNVFALEGEVITQDALSDVIRVQVDGQFFYVKRYVAAGKKLRRYLGRSRVQGEWENLLYFKSLGIPIPSMVAYGARYRCGLFQGGALITAEVPNSANLAAYARQQLAYFQCKSWRRAVIEQVAEYTQRLHQQRFGHFDLKWRNILVTQQKTKPQVYFIDCPLGRRYAGWRWPHARRKDLKCLDELAKKYLTATERLRFYLRYRGHDKLTRQDKADIRAFNTSC